MVGTSSVIGYNVGGSGVSVALDAAVVVVEVVDEAAGGCDDDVNAGVVFELATVAVDAVADALAVAAMGEHAVNECNVSSLVVCTRAFKRGRARPHTHIHSLFQLARRVWLIVLL